MKKVLAAALMCAVSSFATWDYFPVQAAGKGEAKVGFGYLINAGGHEKLSIIGAEIGVRYSIIEGLEASLGVPFMLSASKDGESCKEEGKTKCPPSYGQPVIGVRYWFPFGLGIAVDIDLPFQGDAYADFREDASKGTPLNFRPAIQFSTNFTPELSVGAEVGLGIYGENSETKLKEGMDLGIGVEFDYAIGSITPYIGADIGLGIGKPQYDGKEDPNGEAAKTAIDVGLGATFDINENMAADVGVVLGFGGRYEHEEIDTSVLPPKTETKSVMPITIQAHFSYKF